MPAIDLGMRCLLEIHGPDAVRYLNGQVTQDVRLLARHPQQALASCITDAKGRLQAYVTLYQHDAGRPAIWIEAPADLRESLMARVSRYLIADDAEIDDISEQYRLLHLIDEPTQENDFSHARFGIAGVDRWILADANLTDLTLWDQEKAERLRIQNGIPAWGRELTEGMLPPEAGLDASAISSQKGCYIGQEVISRIKSAGKINRRLCRFLLEGDGVTPGSVLTDESGTAMGEITSIAYPHALGYVSKKGFGQTNFCVRLPEGTVVAHAVLSQPDQR
jgi:folate-binding protein YgfZ